MNTTTLIQSEDVYVLFDGCPTCHPRTASYLNECLTITRQTQRKLHIVPSGSPTATTMRLIAKNKGQRIKYPMILMDGIIRYNPQDITKRTEK